ncbi:MAG: hypothetical protein UZ16_OP3001002976 [Candidatus Hinthialibacteria bacterium OLB16]|nr:MAG: hypothetical protein UZ16_OP3001002976 [Candidatus Hinthialibacteria bacterium OLB16]
MTDYHDLVRQERLHRRIYEVAGILFLLGFVIGFIILYRLGSSHDWKRMDLVIQDGVLPEAEQVHLVGKGAWLVWTNSNGGIVGAYDFNHPGQPKFLQPPPHLKIRIFDVIQGDLVALIVRPQATFSEVLLRGWSLFFSDDPPPLPSALEGRKATTFLVRLNLGTGEIVSLLPGSTSDLKGRQTSLNDFEMGRVSLSSNQISLAWWRAHEEIGSTPLSATVTEHLEVVSTGPHFRKLFEREYATNGTLSIRSRLLNSVGKPLWMTEDMFLYLSFLDQGSLVPFDCREGTIQAAYPLATLQETLLGSVPQLQYEPEGIFVVNGDGKTPQLFLYSRLQDSIHFFVLDSLFRLVRHSRLEAGAYDFTSVVWLETSQTLLVEDHSQRRLVSLTPKGELKSTFPLPPDWDDGFKILGEDSSGQLIGFNRGAFLRAGSGDPAWETLDLFR